ncbi:hypothetical protein ABPG75_013660 [Micractinium tetrahymenae]
MCGSTFSLKSAKSYSDLSEVIKGLPGGLASLRIEERDPSQQSGSEDTGRSSPTEHLLRSRSPCAVLYNSSSQDNMAAAGPEPPRCELLPADTLPFLESAADFCVVEVPPLAAARATAADMQAAPAAAQQPPGLLRTGGGCSLSPADAAAADDPIVAAAAAAAAGAFFSAGVSAASSPPSAQSTVPSSPQHQHQATLPSGLGLPPRPSVAPARQAAQQAAAQQHAEEQLERQLQAAASPFVRLALAEPPSLITPATGLLSQASGLVASRQSSLQLVQPPSLMGACGASDLGSSAGSSPTASTHSHSGSISAEVALARRNSHDGPGWGTSTHLSEGHAAEELFYRLNHARQTVDFVKRQATAFSQLNKAAMGVWEALELLNTLREYESALLGPGDDGVLLGAAPEPPAPDMPLLEHALQCAEACRAAFPDEEHMHLAGLLAPLGKLLAHAKLGAEPQWAICGETFPVGCRFHPSVRHSQFFSANPDRRKRLYSSPTGVYREGCGLGGVLMSWGAGEYLHLVLRLNRVPLPPDALFCIRHLKLRCVFRPGGPYSELLSEFDRVQLPRLAKFQQLCAHRRLPRAEPLLVPVPGAVPCAAGEDPPMQVAPHLKQYYDSLLAKYIPQGVLLW